MPEDISLLPREVEKRREEEARARLLRKVSLVFLGISVLVGVGALLYSLFLRSRLSNLEKNIANETSKISSLSEVELKAQDLGTRVGALKGVLDGKAYFSNLLLALSKSVPADVSIKEMTVPSEEVVSISGVSRSYVSLAKFLLNLKAAGGGDGLFKVVELRSVSLDQQTGEANFDVNLKLAEGGLKQ